MVRRLVSWIPRRKPAGDGAGVSRRELPDFLKVPWSLWDVVLFLVAWFGLQVVGLVIFSVVAAFVPALQPALAGVAKGDINATLALDIFMAVVGFAVMRLILRKYGVGWSALGWRKVGWLRALRYVLGLLLLFVVGVGVIISIVSLLVHGFDANQPQQNDFISGAGQNRLAALLGLVLIPPILEETVFRGLLFPAIAKRAGVVWGAVISSALFAVAHGQANVSVYTFVLGLVLCFLYVRLHSIVPGIAVHMLNNALAFIALLGR